MRRMIRRDGDIDMGMECDICAKKPILGNQKTYRGKAKYLGGVGRKITGTTRRVFYPNLQSIRIVKEGKTVRANVCVQCIRSGNITRPVKKKPFATN
jgi:large subunit ribosomal protein L28